MPSIAAAHTPASPVSLKALEAMAAPAMQRRLADLLQGATPLGDALASSSTDSLSNYTSLSSSSNAEFSSSSSSNATEDGVRVGGILGAITPTFTLIFTMACVGGFLVALLVVLLCCCRKNKLLETDDDEDDWGEEERSCEGDVWQGNTTSAMVSSFF